MLALVGAVLLSCTVPTTSQAQIFPGGPVQSSGPLTSSDPHTYCRAIFAATATDDPRAVVARIGELPRPFVGTIKAYGADRIWSTTVAASATAVKGVSTWGHPAPRETSVLVHADGPIEALEFDPAWAPCAFRAGVRKRTPDDAPDVPRPVVYATGGIPIAPATCPQPYVATSLTHTATPHIPAMAFQQGIAGSVHVGVALDERGAYTAGQVISSPSAVLDQAALDAAKRSSFTPAIFRCQPSPSGYEVTIEFTTR